MTSSKAVGLSWTLSQTATDVVGVSRGMLEAATTDNVSTLALLACEGFGSTLPMSVETKAKMHQVCSQDHQSAVLNFLKAQIGYKRGDSGWQLARSDSGLRFLGLATCLLSNDLWISSELLRVLITETAVDKVLVPTAQQVKALLLVLRYRLEKVAFVQEVLGWNLLLNGKLDRQYDDPVPPSSDVMKKLIRCMCSLARVGDATRHQTLKIRIPQRQAAWTIAFLKWCLGEPPTVTHQDGSAIIASKTSQAEVYPITESRDDDIEISVWDDLKSPRELFQGSWDGLGYVRGMVSAQSYLEAFCERFGPRNSPYYFNALQLVPYALHEAFYRLDFHQILNLHEHTPPDTWRSDALESIRENLYAQGIDANFGSVFPNEETVLETVRKLNHEGIAYSLKKVPDGSTFSQLPPVVAVRELFRTTCECTSCSATSNIAHRECKFTLWLRKISYHVSTLLLLSMMVPIDTTGGILLHYNSYDLSYRTEFTSAIYKCLISTQKKYCSVDGVIKALLHLVGHTEVVSSDTNSWIASSFLGQTMYPQLLQTLHVRPRGSLTILCVPGSLSWNNVNYNLVEEPAIFMHDDDILFFDEEEIEGLPQRLIPPVVVQDEYPVPRLRWRVSAQEKTLKLSVFASNLEGLPRSPLRALWSTLNSCFVSCSHNEHSPCSDEHLFRATPDNHGKIRTDLALNVIQTHRNEVMRYYSLCSLRSCVIRDQACLDCCVRVARLIQMRVVIC